jgi:hypothetical protein
VRGRKPACRVGFCPPKGARGRGHRPEGPMILSPSLYLKLTLPYYLEAPGMSSSPNTVSESLPTGPWTLYFHAPKEKRWSIDTFKPIAVVNTVDDIMGVFQELDDKLKRGMYFFMRGSVPPLWENYQNIRGGSYSLRGGPDDGVDYYKTYIVGSMLGLAVTNTDDTIVGVSISPKIMNGPNGTSKVGFYVIKIWNKDCGKFAKPTGLRLLHSKLVLPDIVYTPHVDKKM